MQTKLRQAQAQTDSEVAARRISGDGHQGIVSTGERQRKELNKALAEVASQNKAAGDLWQLAQAHQEAEEICALEVQSGAQIATLLDYGDESLRSLEHARAQRENLEAQVHAIQGTSRDENNLEGRLLRAQCR